MTLAANTCSQPHLRSCPPLQDPLPKHQHGCVLLAQVPPASAQAHAGEEQEKRTPRQPSKDKGFRNNTPGSRHSDIVRRQLLKEQNNPQDRQQSWPQSEGAPSSTAGPTRHRPAVTRESETGGYTLWLGPDVIPGASASLCSLQQPSWP